MILYAVLPRKIILTQVCIVGQLNTNCNPIQVVILKYSYNCKQLREDFFKFISLFDDFFLCFELGTPYFKKSSNIAKRNNMKIPKPENPKLKLPKSIPISQLHKNIRFHF